MARPKKIWINEKKFGRKRVWEGNHRRFRKDRVFELTDGKRVITFESFQAAKVLGWKAKESK